MSDMRWVIRDIEQDRQQVVLFVALRPSPTIFATLDPLTTRKGGP
jgi:hypothetical protein